MGKIEKYFEDYQYLEYKKSDIYYYYCYSIVV